MTSARWPNKTSPAHTASLKDNVAFTHRQKCLCGSRGVPHHMPRDPGKVLACLPLCAWGNRLADLGPEVAHEPAPTTLSHGLGAPREHCLRQWWPHAIHRWQSAHGSPSFQQRSSSTALKGKKKKKSMSGHMGEGKWNSLTLPTQPLLRQQSLGPGEPFSAVTPPMGAVMDDAGGGNMWVSTWLLQLCRMLPKRPTSLSHQQSTESSEARLGAVENDGERGR